MNFTAQNRFNIIKSNNNKKIQYNKINNNNY